MYLQQKPYLTFQKSQERGIYNDSNSVVVMSYQTIYKKMKAKSILQGF